MDEMYRMLGRERQADLDREALRWQQAAALRNRPSVAITLWRAIATHAPRPASSKPGSTPYRSGEDRTAPGAHFIEVSKLSDSTANQIHATSTGGRPPTASGDRPVTRRGSAFLLSPGSSRLWLS